MPSYTGLSIQHRCTGEIDKAQIIDAEGIEHSIDADEYIQRGIQPPIEQLKAQKPASLLRWFLWAVLFGVMAFVVWLNCELGSLCSH